MGHPHYAKLVYGYDLGSDETPKVREVGEYDSLQADWMKRDDDGFVNEDLGDAVIRRLYEAIPGAEPGLAERWQQIDPVRDYFGVWIEDHGWVSDGQASYALVAAEFSVWGGESVVLDPAELQRQEEQGQYDQKLDRALEVLAGMTPSRRRGWTLLADR